MTFANSLDPDQDRQNVGPDLDLNCWTLIDFLRDIFLKRLILKKSKQLMTKAKKNYPACKTLT